MVVGGLAAGAVAHDQPPSYFFTETIGGILGGWVGGSMPDFIEPANSASHRKSAHSWTTLLVNSGALGADVGAGVSYLRESAARWRVRALDSSLQRGPRNAATAMEYGCHFLAGLTIGFLAGYASHLMMDAATPAGLPLA